MVITPRQSRLLQSGRFIFLFFFDNDIEQLAFSDCMFPKIKHQLQRYFEENYYYLTINNPAHSKCVDPLSAFTVKRLT